MHFTIEPSSWDSGLALVIHGEPKTLVEAFDASIAKFQIVAEHAKKDKQLGNLDAETCGLCIFFDIQCERCPIGRYYGHSCYNTPYYDVIGSQGRDRVKYCNKEIKMLKSLKAKLMEEGRME